MNLKEEILKIVIESLREEAANIFASDPDLHEVLERIANRIENRMPSF